MRGILWPVNGLMIFLRQPHLWGKPLGALFISWIILLSAGLGVMWWRWPSEAANWWPWPWHICAAVGVGLVAMLIAWIIMLPLLMGFALESLARAVQRRAGALDVSEESLWAALKSSLRIAARTLPLRLAWTGTALIASFFGPLGLIVGAFGMSHMACIDAMDVALAVRGISGQRRSELLRIHREDIIQGAMSGALMNLGLGVTVVGWLLWLPSLVAGAAIRVLTWPEVMDTLPVTIEPPATVTGAATPLDTLGT